MKKSTLFFLVLLFSTFAFGQKYVPFPTKNAEWNVKLSYYPYEYPKLETSLVSYSLQGDTIVNQIVYKKICQNIGSVQNPVYVGIGGLRESDKKIYYVGNGYSTSVFMANKQKMKRIESCLFSENDGNEILLYDFNVKVGDTIHWGYAYNEDIIAKIDSILIGNKYWKSYRFKYSNDLIVEGIGSVVNGLLGSVTPMIPCGLSISWEFICFSRFGETQYLNPAFKDCNSMEKWNDINSVKTNTQWYYGETVYPVYTPTIHYEDYNLLKSIGDTVISGVRCNILSQIRGNAGCASFDSPAYVYQSNDTLYFYNSPQKIFKILYVYGTGAGSSWIVDYPYGSVKVNVDSVSSVQALGRTLKLQYVTYSSVSQSVYGYAPKSTIIESIGDINYFFQSSLLQRSDWVCDELGKDRKGLRCYVHPDYGTYKTGLTACDFVTSISMPEYSSIKVYLASSCELKIENEILTEPYTFELMDLRGVVILKTELDANINSISIGNFSNGLYMYRLTDNGKLLKSGKIVKM